MQIEANVLQIGIDGEFAQAIAVEVELVVLYLIKYLGRQTTSHN